MEEKTITITRKKRTVEYTCQRCGRVVIETRWPGPTPQYCATCGPIVKREKNADRQRQYRAQKRETHADE